MPDEDRKSASPLPAVALRCNVWSRTILCERLLQRCGPHWGGLPCEILRYGLPHAAIEPRSSSSSSAAVEELAQRPTRTQWSRRLVAVRRQPAARINRKPTTEPRLSLLRWRYRMLDRDLNWPTSHCES